MIDVRGLTKRYGLDTVVDDLSFTVEAGPSSAVGRSGVSFCWSVPDAWVVPRLGG